MKIVNAIPGMTAMNKAKADSFLESNLNIQPVWFYHERNASDLYVMTNKMSKKIQNVCSKPKVYFSIDDENFPYNGVKGKGTATIVEDFNAIMQIMEKVNLKYSGMLDHPSYQNDY